MWPTPGWQPSGIQLWKASLPESQKVPEQHSAANPFPIQASVSPSGGRWAAGAAPPPPPPPLSVRGNAPVREGPRAAAVRDELQHPDTDRGEGGGNPPVLKVKHLYSVGRRERWGGSVGVSGLDLIEKTPQRLMLKRGKGRRNNSCIYIYIYINEK